MIIAKRLRTVRFGGIELTATVTRGLGNNSATRPSAPSLIQQDRSPARQAQVHASPPIGEASNNRAVEDTAEEHQNDAEPSQNVRYHTLGDQSHCKTTGPISQTARFLRAEAIQRAVASVRSLPGAHSSVLCTASLEPMSQGTLPQGGLPSPHRPSPYSHSRQFCEMHCYHR